MSIGYTCINSLWTSAQSNALKIKLIWKDYTSHFRLPHIIDLICLFVSGYQLLNQGELKEIQSPSYARLLKSFKLIFLVFIHVLELACR